MSQIKAAFIFSLLILLITSCFSNEKKSLIRLKSQIKTYCVDNTISSEEWQDLNEEIQSNRALYLREGFLQGEEVNTNKLIDLIHQQEGEEIVINGKPGNDSSSFGSDKPVYNAFIENSASMDGYVNGASAFKNSVYSFLSDLKSPLRNITDSLNLYYVNSKTIPFRDDVKDFIEKLDPTTFRSRGGNRGQTDISNVFKIIFDQTPPDHVNVLVSDCVFSPGRNRNATDYLVNQSIGIKNQFEQKLSQTKNFSTIVYQLHSKFDGLYYDLENKGQKITEERPYYIWVLGPQEHVDHMLNQLDVTRLSGLKHQHIFASERSKPDYRVLINKRYGIFRPSKNQPKTGIESAKPETRGPNTGMFRFAVGVNLDGFGFDESYIKDPENYRINNEDYSIEIERIGDSEKSRSEVLKNYTHYLLLSTNKIKTEELEIELLRQMPNWVNQSHSMNDKNQIGDELSKTYGIKYLIDGVKDAYLAAVKDSDTYFKISVSISK